MCMKRGHREGKEGDTACAEWKRGEEEKVVAVKKSSSIPPSSLRFGNWVLGRVRLFFTLPPFFGVLLPAASDGFIFGGAVILARSWSLWWGRGAYNALGKVLVCHACTHHVLAEQKLLGGLEAERKGGGGSMRGQ